MSENKYKKTILDQVKDLEIAKKQRLLLKNIQKLKELCADVLETKEETNILLKKLGISKEDGKALIDFLNESEDVKLNDERREEIEERVDKDLKREKSEISNEVEKAINKFPEYFNGGAVTTFTSSKYSNLSDAGGTCNANGNSLNANNVGELASAAYFSSANCLNVSNGSTELKLKI